MENNIKEDVFKTLIDKHFKRFRGDSITRSSIQYYLDSGSISGEFYLALKEFAEDISLRADIREALVVLSDDYNRKLKEIHFWKTEFEKVVEHWYNGETPNMEKVEFKITKQKTAIEYYSNPIT